MKKFKKIIIIYMFCLFATLFVGCGDSTTPATPKTQEPTKLSTPIIKWDQATDRVYWDVVPNAAKYEVVYCDTILGDNVTINYNNYLELENGSYSIKVKAISESPNYINSDFTSIKDIYIRQAPYSYVQKEIVGSTLKIYFFDFGDIPDFEIVNIYDKNNNLNFKLTKNDCVQSKSNFIIYIGTTRLHMEDRGCLVYEKELENLDNLSLRAKFLSDTEFVKSYDCGIYDKAK